jgi:hypothetical protein
MLALKIKEYKKEIFCSNGSIYDDCLGMYLQAVIDLYRCLG